MILVSETTTNVRRWIGTSIAATLALAAPGVASAQTLPVWGVPTQIVGVGPTVLLGVTTDSHGNVIYTDTANSRLIATTPSGQTFSFGTGSACGNLDPADPPGAAAGNNCLGQPTSVAVDSSDLVYVTDYGNDRIVVLDSVNAAVPLKYLSSFGTRGGPHGAGANWIADASGGIGTPNQFDGPYTVDVDRSVARASAGVNHVYVLDTWNNRLAAWDCNQTQLRAGSTTACAVNTALSFGNNGGIASNPPPPLFNGPQGFGVDQATGDIAVAEFNTLTADLFRYPFTGATWGWVGSIGTAFAADTSSGPGQLSNPTDIKFDASGNMWVADQSNNRIQVFSQTPRTGTAAATFKLMYQPMDAAGYTDPTGNPLDLIAPQTLALDSVNNRLFVTDLGNNRIEVWQPAALAATLTFDSASPLSGLATTATLKVTNTGGVPLANIRAGITVSSGLTLLPLTIPATTLAACAPSTACPSVTFSVPFLLTGSSPVTASVTISGDHAFSGAHIVSPTVQGSVSPAAPPSGIGITTVSVTPNPVQSGGAITMSVTLQNTGQVQVDNASVVITPGSATCVSCATPAVASLAPNASFTWSNLRYTAAAAGTASFAVNGSSTVHNATTVVTTSASASTPIKSDTSAPTTTVTFTSAGQTAPNVNGFWRSAVTATFTATDSQGVTSLCYTIQPQPPFVGSKCIATGGTPTTFSTSISIGYDGVYSLTYWAVDASGNSGQSAAGTGSVRLDQTPPNALFSQPTPAANSHGWNNTPMTWTVATSDNLSGVASVTFGGAPLTGSTIPLSAQGTCVQATIVITDNAGNVSVQPSPCTNIDIIKPTGTPTSANGVITFPTGSTSDAAPPAGTLPAGVTVSAFQASSVDPTSLPAAAGIPASTGSWTICDMASNCTPIFFAAELVNQFDPVAKADALYARYGMTGYVPTALVAKGKTHNSYSSHHWSNGSSNYGGYGYGGNYGGNYGGGYGGNYGGYSGGYYNGYNSNNNYSGSWHGHDDDRWSNDDHDDHDDCDVTTFELKDSNGNGIVMVEHIQKTSSTETHVGVVSFSYITGCPTNCVTKAGVVPGGTTKNFSWSLDSKTGKYTGFQQELLIGRDSSQIRVNATYDSKKNRTTISRDGNHNCFSVTLPGMVLLDMATLNGKLVIEYNGTVVSQ